MFYKNLKEFPFFKDDKINIYCPDCKNRKLLLNKLKAYDGVKVGTFAKSTCNRDMDFICFGEPKGAVLLCGAFHAMESITALLLIVFAFELANKLSCEKSLKSKLCKRGLFIVPCVNPDGVEIFCHGARTAGRYENLVSDMSKGDKRAWQANAKGVDLNHNFDALWEKLHDIEVKSGIVAPSATRYGGEYPESEVETQALVKLCKCLDFSVALAFHSQGEEIYWSFNGMKPKGAEKIAKELSEKSGYTLSYPEEEIASYGGFKDWFISYFNRPAFTIEVGKGKNPLPLSDLDVIYLKLREMLFLLTDM